MIAHPWNETQAWIHRSPRIFLKKLARNDCAWADGAHNGHQNGVYIPREIRECGFFPQLAANNPSRPHILDTRFRTLWPGLGEIHDSALKHYTNKGTEMHFTRVPREEFIGLTPASFLIGGSLPEPEADCTHWFMVIDSAAPEAEIIESVFDLDSNFHFGIFDPHSLRERPEDSDATLIAEITEALRRGTLEQFIMRMAVMDGPASYARQAQEVWLREAGQPDMSPWRTPEPGNAIMRISRDIEYTIFKRAEKRLRAAEVVRALARTSDLPQTVVTRYAELDGIFMSAAQTRKSRAGRSFEIHVARMLGDGGIRYEEQIPVGSRRPDFMLPGVSRTISATPNSSLIVLSLKTTLRERWKQVNMERMGGQLFLATVDDRVTADAINDMSTNDITLVVPESLKDSKETCYKRHANVITFREFFDIEIASKRPGLRT